MEQETRLSGTENPGLGVHTVHHQIHCVTLQQICEAEWSDFHVTLNEYLTSMTMYLSMSI